MTKTALIIGAQDYDPRDGLTPLACARNDALALGRLLRERCDFGTIRVLAGEGIAGSDGRPTKKAIRDEIRRLAGSPTRIDVLLVAVCAHGLTLPVGDDDRYYLLPEDAHGEEPDSFLEFADIMRRLNEIPADHRAVIFDTCRSRPEAGRAGSDNLLARDLTIELLSRPDRGRDGTTCVMTACSVGQRAYEMQDAGHGVFFHFLLNGMAGPAWTAEGLSVNAAFTYAEREIADRPIFAQRPTFEQKGGRVIYLAQGGAKAQTPAQGTPSPARKAAAAERPVPAAAASPGSGYPVPVGGRFRDAPDAPEMVVIPAGSFLMGSPEGEDGRKDNEGPQRRVTVRAPLAVGRYAVTVGEYRAFVEATRNDEALLPSLKGDVALLSLLKSVASLFAQWDKPSFPQNDQHPVTHVSWRDAQAFAAWLSERTGRGYRLLTEAEWEYACRAGTTTRYSSGAEITEAQANFNRTGGGTVAVGSLAANPWGLHEMHGNVWEWVEDVWEASYAGAPFDAAVAVGGLDDAARVLRGGSWLNSPRLISAAVRNSDRPDFSDNYIGFRVARTPG